MATIYLDTQTQSMIDQIRQDNPEFNLSGFIRNCLKEHTDFDESMPLDKINHLIEQKKLDLDKVEKEIEYYENMKINTLAADKMKLEQDHKNYMENVSRAIKYFNIDQNKAGILVKDFQSKRRRISLVQYMMDKGYAMREVGKQDE